MSWEDEEFDVNLPTAVKGNWDDEDAPEGPEEEEKPQAAPRSTKPAKVKAAAMKAVSSSPSSSAQHASQVAEPEEDDPETAKAKRNQAILDADFENAKGMFEGLDQSNLINISNPQDEKDFEALASSLSQKLGVFRKSIHYVIFLKSLLRQTAAELSSDDIRELERVVGAVLNEKLKLEKAASKPAPAKAATGKKKKGPSKLNMKDDDDGGGDYDDYEDFM